MNINFQNKYPEFLKNKIRNYYKNYYQVELGLNDWSRRCELRVNEELNFSSKHLEFLQNIGNNFNNKKILIVGSGTGGEIVCFNKLKAEVHGIEPNEAAYNISIDKAKIHKIDEKKILRVSSEEIPFSTSYFDYVICNTVLEHVNDVEKTISEMIRVTNILGKLIIITPDYRNFWEPHYKLPLPMFLPNFINFLILKLISRPTNFLFTINKINSKILINIFKKYNVNYLRVYFQKKNAAHRNIIKNLFFKIFHQLYSRFFEIELNQFWILLKKEDE